MILNINASNNINAIINNTAGHILNIKYSIAPINIMINIVNATTVKVIISTPFKNDTISFYYMIGYLGEKIIKTRKIGGQISISTHPPLCFYS